MQRHNVVRWGLQQVGSETGAGLEMRQQRPLDLQREFSFCFRPALILLSLSMLQRVLQSRGRTPPGSRVLRLLASLHGNL